MWRYNPRSQAVDKVITQLAKQDFASFFWQDNGLYYVSRDEQHDYIRHYSVDGDVLIDKYLGTSIRRFFGIAPATDDSFMITLSGINDADIYQISAQPLNQATH